MHKPERNASCPTCRHEGHPREAAEKAERHSQRSVMLVTNHQNGISTIASAEAAGGSSPPQTERFNRGNTMLNRSDGGEGGKQSGIARGIHRRILENIPPGEAATRIMLKSMVGVGFRARPSRSQQVC